MIRHVVMFRWRDDFPTEQRQAWLEAVRQLPRRIDVLKSLSAGPDVLGLSRSWHAAIVADFERVEDIAIYTHHPAHLPLIEVSGVGAERIASVDFEV